MLELVKWRFTPSSLALYDCVITPCFPEVVSMLALVEERERLEDYEMK
jgi:hypothetical protein